MCHKPNDNHGSLQCSTQLMAFETFQRVIKMSHLLMLSTYMVTPRDRHRCVPTFEIYHSLQQISIPPPRTHLTAPIHITNLYSAHTSSPPPLPRVHLISTATFQKYLFRSTTTTDFSDKHIARTNPIALDLRHVRAHRRKQFQRRHLSPLKTRVHRPVSLDLRSHAMITISYHL